MTTALVPRTVVAGTGIGQLVVYGTRAIILGIVAYLLFSLVPRYARNRWGNKANSVAMQFLVACFAGWFAWSLAKAFRTDFSWSLQESLAAGIGAVVIPFAMVLLADAFLRRRRRRTSADRTEGPDERDAPGTSYKGDVDSAAMKGEPPKAANDNSKRLSVRWLWPGWSWVVLIIASYYVLTTYIVVLSEPALPAVEVSGVKDMEGTLLTHTDGFWYVFDDAGNNKGELIALRDDQVESVTLSSGNKPSEDQ
jgi:hypothetical protein